MELLPQCFQTTSMLSEDLSTFSALKTLYPLIILYPLTYFDPSVPHSLSFHLQKQLSMQEEADGQEAYPTTMSLPRQSTVAGDQVTRRQGAAATNSTPHNAANGTTSPSIASGSSHNSNSSNSKNTPSKTKTPPTSRGEY